MSAMNSIPAGEGLTSGEGDSFAGRRSIGLVLGDSRLVLVA